MWADWQRRVAIGGAILVALAGIGVGAYFLVDTLRDEPEPAPPAAAPRIVVRTDREQPEAPQEVGFPEFATKNTTRVAGADPVADAAGVALAVFPSTGGVPGPAAVTLVDAADWRSAIAAASLAGPPVAAPILISGADEVPPLTADTVDALAPEGSAETKGAQVFRIGRAAVPSGLDVERASGGSPAEIAAEIDSLGAKLTGTEPKDVLLVSTAKPRYGMPAAAWAARSGEPVLFVTPDSVPKPTADALKRHEDADLFALGPPPAISDDVLKEVEDIASPVTRVGDADAVQNAIDFARYSRGSFGWDINDPGHGLVIASDSDPLVAAAAATLSASGTWGPLLLTDDSNEVPTAMRGFLLDIKPGYLTDPTRAVYNHVWLIGDERKMSVGFQAQVDDLAEVAPVRSGTGTDVKPPPSKPNPSKRDADQKKQQ